MLGRRICFMLCKNSEGAVFRPDIFLNDNKFCNGMEQGAIPSLKLEFHTPHH